MFLALIGCIYFATGCEDHLYPPIFLFCGCFILAQQLFDLVFYWNDYLIKWDDLPPMHITKLYYNKELFQKQSKVLFYSNLLFGSFAMITILVGFKFVNSNHTHKE